MSTTTAPARVEGTNVVVMQTPTLQWALRRALLGIVILFVTIAAAATLLYASIDPEEDGRPALTAPAGAAPAIFSAPPTDMPRRA